MAVRARLLCLLFGAASFSQSPASTFVNLPLTFESNLGQAPQGVRFLTRSGNSTALFFDKEVVVVQGKRFLRLKTGTNPKPKLEGMDSGAGRSNYMHGPDQTRWRTNVPQYGRLRYRGIYPGVDLIFHGEESKLEYDFVVSPGANVDAIRLSLQGAGELSIGANGDLEASGIPVQEAPIAYQLVGSVRTRVSCRYQLVDRDTVAFQLGEYDRSLPLVIDPVLVYSTFLAGPNDGISSTPKIAVDQAGFVYVAGTTQSAQFPVTTNAFDSQYHGNVDVFVAKLDPTGTKLVYSTYLGGSDNDASFGLAIDAAGNAYIVGSTSSADFPVTTGSFQTRFSGGTDAFAVKLDPTGSHLVYATYLGGSNSDAAAKVAVDAFGNAFITGVTASTDFPTTGPALQAKYAGGSFDTFLAKLNPSGATLLYSTYLGGSGSDSAAGIALDGAGNIYLAGTTSSEDFPTTPGSYQNAYPGAGAPPLVNNTNVFVVKVDALGSRLVYSTFLGGTFTESASAIAVDQTGSAYVVGSTNSQNFPTTPGSFQPVYAGRARDINYPTNAFVTKLNPAGTGLSYSTYLGGSGLNSTPTAGDGALSITIDQSGLAYVAGSAASSDFPLKNPIQQSCGIYCGLFVSSTGFIAELDPTGSSLLFSTFLGGFAFEALNRTGTYVSSIALGGTGIYVAGGNGANDFPATPGAFQTTFQRQGNNSRVTFIAKIDPLAPPQTAAANVVNSASYLGGPVAPGEFISIFGVGLGQVHGVRGQLSPSGTLLTTLGGTTVTFDGVAAPLLYADANQINAIVPYSVTGATQMQVSFQNTTSAKITLAVAPTAPGIFLQTGSGLNQGLIVNQDGTLNSPSNPAARGSVVVFYAIGGGVMVPAQQDGVITPLTPPWPKPELAPLVTIGGIPAKLSYAGAAPGLVAGVLQINAEVPDGSPTGSAVPLSLAIGASTAQVNIAVR